MKHVYKGFLLKSVLITIALMTTSCSDASSGCSKEETLKLIGAGYTKDDISGMCDQTEKQNGSQSTINKTSTVEGKLVDWNEKPVADVTITASQLQPIKGYEQFEAKTDSDGSFRITGLFPSSTYTLKPWSNKWRSKTAVQVESAPQGEAAVLSLPIVIAEAFSKESGILVGDLATNSPFQSAVEGKYIDWKGNPIANTHIVAMQEQPIKGYEQFEAKTNSDGSFRITGLFPSSTYTLNIVPENWHCITVTEVSSAHQNETLVLPSPITISEAYARKSGSVLSDLTTGETRFNLDDYSGIISDSKTGFDWIVRGYVDMNRHDTEQWLESISDDIDGGGWRMPTISEYKSLNINVGQRFIDPVFGTDGWWAWVELSDSSSSNNSFSLNRKRATYRHANNAGDNRAFAVRSKKTRSPDDIISDSQTGLDWLAGPNEDTNYHDAKQWITSISNDAGGGWRMPTRQELATLYQKGRGERNMNPAFKITGWYVWAEPRDSESALGFRFDGSSKRWFYHHISDGGRVFAVRSR